MNYTHKTLKSAIFYIVPNFGKAVNNGVPMNVPQMLSTVAETIFIESLESEYNPSFEKRVAVMICQEALKDLHTKGFMEEGQNTFDFGE